MGKEFEVNSEEELCDLMCGTPEEDGFKPIGEGNCNERMEEDKRVSDV